MLKRKTYVLLVAAAGAFWALVLILAIVAIKDRIGSIRADVEPATQPIAPTP